MAPPRTQSPVKSPRQSRLTDVLQKRRSGRVPALPKTLHHGRMASASINTTPNQEPRMPESTSGVNVAQILNMFRVIHEQEEPSASQSDDDRPRKRLSYSREQKLAAVAYASTTFRLQKDGTMKPISAYEAAKELGITQTMLRKWKRGQNSIMLQKKGTRKAS